MIWLHTKKYATLTKIVLLSIAIMLFSSINKAYALLNIDITQGNVDPLPIALPYLGSENSDTAKTGRNIMLVVEADLERSGLFRSIDRKAFIQEIRSIYTMPIFPSWRQINATALVTGGIDFTGKHDNEIETQFRLWDTFAEQQMEGKSYVTNQDNWRRIAHLIADRIYSRITGENGYFDTRIAYIAEDGHAKKRRKRLAIMDQDGANHAYLTDGNDLVLTPRFDRNIQRVIYLSYAANQPRVHMRDLESGKDSVVGTFPGMSFAPRFSPDGRSVIMAVSLEGNSEIFTYSLTTKKTNRLTHDQAIDVSPSYSPDGKNIAFTSDRGGTQQLYVMDNNGKNARRISFGKGKYSAPAWSPRGDLIAFTKIYRGKFYIGVMSPDGDGERLLTESFLDEGPSWSPNGRVIAFTRQTPSYGFGSGKSHIYSIDLTGYNERKIPTPGEASDPAWSPLL